MNHVNTKLLTAALLAIGFIGTSAYAATSSNKASSSHSTMSKSSAVRDWSAIDTNHDHLIEPAEMEAALKEVGPQAKNQKD